MPYRPEEKKIAKREELTRLSDMWKSVDTDGGGSLDWQELKQVFEKMGRKLSEKEMDQALNEIDKDGGGDVDFDEFMKWWAQQDIGDTARMEKQKIFEQLLATFQPGEIISILLSGPRGPEEAKLVSPQGLFRLVLRAKSAHAKEFHEWAEQMTSKAPSGASLTKRDQTMLRPDRLPNVEHIRKDFVLRNLIIAMNNKDEWFFHKSAPANATAAGLLASNEVKLFTMELTGAH